MNEQTSPIRSLLVPVDLSAGARDAVELAAFLADRLGARVRVLHAVTHVPELSDGEAFVNAFAGESAASFRENAMAAAEKEVEIFVADRLPGADVIVKIGRPVELILEEAESGHSDLIVMGTHGRTGLRRIAMGSVAENVVRRATCPVLTVRSRGEASDAET